MTVDSPRFPAERRRYRLVFTCEDCAHFVPDTGACAHGYPNEDHRAAEGTRVVFCKEFDPA